LFAIRGETEGKRNQQKKRPSFFQRSERKKFTEKGGKGKAVS